MKSILMGAMLTIMLVRAIDPVVAVQALQACLYAEGLDLIGRMTLPDDVADLGLVRCEEQLEEWPTSSVSKIQLTRSPNLLQIMPRSSDRGIINR